MHRMKKTKIVATLGPASDGPAAVKRLIAAGANVFRINASHASPDEIRRQIRNIRKGSAAARYHAAVLLDLGGPKIRVGEFESGEMQLRDRKEVLMKVTRSASDGSFIPVWYEGFYHDVGKGNRVLLDDGKMALEVIDKKGGVIRATVLNGGILKNKKGINLPEASISAAPVTAKDLRDLKVGMAEGVDYVALSFVREAGDVVRIKKLIARAGSRAEVVSKIERHEAVRNIDAIIDVSGAVMVARGDLGVEMPLVQVPVIQRDIIHKCCAAGKPVIVATQMMESMLNSPRPTRADISDVSGAVHSYADALMLSGETAVGRYPEECVRVMAGAAMEMERYQHDQSRTRSWDISREKIIAVNHAIARTAVSLADILDAAGIVVVTDSGYMVKQIAVLHPNTSIFAFTRYDYTLRKLALVRGAVPFLQKFGKEIAQSLPGMLAQLKRRGLVKQGDRLVLVSGMRMDGPTAPNMVRVETVP